MRASTCDDKKSSKTISSNKMLKTKKRLETVSCKKTVLRFRSTPSPYLVSVIVRFVRRFRNNGGWFWTGLVRVNDVNGFGLFCSKRPETDRTLTWTETDRHSTHGLVVRTVPKRSTKKRGGRPSQTRLVVALQWTETTGSGPEHGRRGESDARPFRPRLQFRVHPVPSSFTFTPPQPPRSS